MSRKGWKLCTNHAGLKSVHTLDLALQASGCDQVHVIHKPRLLQPLLWHVTMHGEGHMDKRVQLRLAVTGPMGYWGANGIMPLAMAAHRIIPKPRPRSFSGHCYAIH